MYNDDRWQGFIDCDFDVTIDLGKETDIKQVCAEFIQLKGPYVWITQTSYHIELRRWRTLRYPSDCRQ